MPDASRTLRAELAASLPARIRAQLEAYERFAAEEPPADAKGFAAWQAAAKAALAHVELLVKLARWAEGEAAAESPDSGMAALLAEARAALGDLDDDLAEDDG